jgi:hypothetical protein
VPELVPGDLEFTREDLTDIAVIKTALAGVNRKLDRILAHQEQSNRRIDALEADREHRAGQEEGYNRAAARTAGVVAFIVSTVLGIAAIVVACWRS